MKAGAEDSFLRNSIGSYPRGRKIVVQVTPTVSEKKKIPVFVEELDAVSMWREKKFNTPPVMIYGDQVTHIVTEKGIAFLNRCSDLAERMSAVRVVAGDTPVGRTVKPGETDFLRKKGVIATPGDLGIDRKDASRELLAAQSFDDLVRWSGGLYKVPEKCFSSRKN